LKIDVGMEVRSEAMESEIVEISVVISFAYLASLRFRSFFRGEVD